MLRFQPDLVLQMSTTCTNLLIELHHRAAHGLDPAMARFVVL